MKKYICFSVSDYYLHLESTELSNTEKENENNKNYFHVKSYAKKSLYAVTCAHVCSGWRDEMVYTPDNDNPYFSHEELVARLLSNEMNFAVTDNRVTAEILRYLISTYIDDGLWMNQKKVIVWEFMHMSNKDAKNLFLRAVDYNGNANNKTRFVAPRNLQFRRKHVRIPVRRFKMINLYIPYPIPSDTGLRITSAYNNEL